MPFISREMQIKARKNHCMPTTMAKFPKIDNTNCSQECGAIFIPRWWECKLVQPLWKTVWQLLPMLNIISPYDPAVELLGIYPTDLKTYVHTKPVCKCL